MISTLNDIKKGLNLIHENEPHLVMEARFVRMQQRKPVMQTKLKNLISGKVVEINFHPGDRVMEADLQRKKADYLYQDGDYAYFMAQDDFEQFSLSHDQIKSCLGYLKEGDKVDVLYFNNQPLSISLPAKVELKVVAAPEAVRGNSAQGRVTKTAEVETGLKLQVPLFIKIGDIIRVNTETGEYSERVN